MIRLLLIIEHGVHLNSIPSRDCHKADLGHMMIGNIRSGANHGKFGGVS
ncbi:MAG: hypothetical protein VXY05_02610 [Pseudomonadota bacterium]|jgi:hypothetical protein|nr:hypothetical protein [Pseudomonadota bacterium]